jgi:hypothetical protein
MDIHGYVPEGGSEATIGFSRFLVENRKEEVLINQNKGSIIVKNSKLMRRSVGYP